MADSVHDITKYAFARPENYVFDANVWLFLYGPSDMRDPRTSIYSLAFDRILKSKSKIHVDVTVLSEYVNRHARLEFDLIREYTDLKVDSFKQFRASPKFPQIAADISAVARRIIKLCARVESGFSACPIENMLEEFAKGTRDFNDQIITHACKTQNFILVTDDGDFRGDGIRVLTANQKLLRPAP